MKTITVLVGTALTGLAVAGAATANAAPSTPTDAARIVMQLQDQGNTVVVNRTGALPLHECTVTGVRAGQTYMRFDSGYPGAQQDPMTTITSMTVYVDAAC